MNRVPGRNKNFLNKPILTFNGEIAVDASDTYESSLFTDIPGLSVGQTNFVEAPINTHSAILGLPWLEKVNPDIDWKHKTIRPRANCQETFITLPTSNNYIHLDDTYDSEHVGIQVNAISSYDAQAENVNMVLPNNLKFMAEVFSKTNADQLPPYRNGIDMTIDIPMINSHELSPWQDFQKKRNQKQKNKQTIY